VRDLLSWNPVPISASLYESAWEIEERWNLSWWDSLIAASAHHAGCSLLLSEDMHDGLDLGGLRIVNPFSPRFELSVLD
jgi:predicted nucleic acid-binding protein